MHRGSFVSLPDHALKLLLSDVVRDLAIHLTGAQGHRQRLGHIVLYCHRDGGVLIRRSYPDVCRARMFELSDPQLGDLGARHERQHDIGGESLFQMVFYT